MNMIESVVKVLLNYLSNAVGAALPDEPSEKQLVEIKNACIVAYPIAKTYGARIVASTENDIDDKVLAELIESCEDAATKYGFSLDATKL